MKSVGMVDTEISPITHKQTIREEENQGPEKTESFRKKNKKRGGGVGETQGEAGQNKYRQEVNLNVKGRSINYRIKQENMMEGAELDIRWTVVKKMLLALHPGQNRTSGSPVSPSVSVSRRL